MTVPSEQTGLVVFADPSSDGPDHDAITRHVERLLQSSAFAGSRRSQTFLRYVVAETLAGRGHDIKERNIAIDVFRKGAAFNPQTESIVRVNAGEVRKRLKAAYEGGLGDDFEIDLPIGTYQPVFRSKPPVAKVVSAPEPAPVVQPTRRLERTLLVLCAILASVVVAWGAIRTRHPSPPLDVLWQPFVHQTATVLIALPSPIVLELRDKEKWPALEKKGLLPASELGRKENYYVGVGAAFGASRFAEQLASRKQSFFLGFGSDVTFADLQRAPAILLGAYSSPWSIEMTRNLRFHFEHSEDWLSVVDSRDPTRVWRIPRVKNSSETSEGYAVVSRLLNSESGQPLLIAAGMSPGDTQAAAEFITDPQYFDLFAENAAADWPKKNFQVILHNNMHGHSPGSPAIVASYVW